MRWKQKTRKKECKNRRKGWNVVQRLPLKSNLPSWREEVLIKLRKQTKLTKLENLPAYKSSEQPLRK